MIFPDLVKAAQLQLDIEARKWFPDNWRIQLINDLQDDFDQGQWPKGFSNTTHLYYDVDGGDSGGAYTNKYVLYLYNSLESNTLVVLPEGLAVILYYNSDSVYQNDLPYYIVQAIMEHLLKSERDMFNHETHKINSEVVFVSPNSTSTVLFPLVWNDLGVRVLQYNDTIDLSMVSDTNITRLAYYLEEDNNHVENSNISNYTVPEPYKRLSRGMEDFMANDIASNLGLTTYPSGNLELRLLSMTRHLCLKVIESNSEVRRKLQQCLKGPHNYDAVTCWIACLSRLDSR
ncbi:uncharacterized protein KQ657_001563 [Scheffersomyces spartinae]|uniref:Uncharacterized protein n=1 Tax=Scheffersomyces spartinae TaxID=45513 RepID=A0A9P7V7R4_9ASCO|nr:uncharacterized protein KQ657_001563 [Scheffersomyces spartinae]KAG7192780.1 hypothetical protein KQ657_001563 [Scheffersomyces spartinae]